MRNLIIILTIFFIGCVNNQKLDYSINKEFTIKDGMYLSDIKVFVTEDTLPVIKYLSRYDSVYSKGDFLNRSGLTYNLYNGESIVWISKNEPDLVVHELFHCSSFILSSVGLVLSDATEEVYAYHIDFLIRQYYNNIK
jgi:hypothetical protein